MSNMYHGGHTPTQSSNMTSIVYVQNVRPNPVTYYATATESASNSQSLQQLTPPMSFVYPAAASQPRMHTPPQQAVTAPNYAPKSGGPYYVYPQGPHDVANVNAGNVFYMVPHSTSSNSQQLSLLIQPLVSGPSSFHGGPAPPPQDSYVAAPALPQILTTDYVPMALDTLMSSQPQPQPQPQQQLPAIDPAVRAKWLATPEVCRHYINGRCNRRKCRFRHPDPNDSAMLLRPQLAPHDTSSILSGQARVTPQSLNHYNLSLSSLNSYSAPAPAWMQPREQH